MSVFSFCVIQGRDPKEQALLEIQGSPQTWGPARIPGCWMAGERKEDTGGVWRERTRNGKGDRLEFGVGLSVVLRFLS